jgi:hypothetical protein
LNTTGYNSNGSKITEAIGKTVVGVGQGNDYAVVVAKAIENAGSLERIVRKGLKLLNRRIRIHTCGGVRARQCELPPTRLNSEKGRHHRISDTRVIGCLVIVE